jgi:hypothetical protein
VHPLQTIDGPVFVEEGDVISAGIEGFPDGVLPLESVSTIFEIVTK